MRQIDRTQLTNQYNEFIKEQESIMSLKVRAANRQAFVERLLVENGFEPSLYPKLKKYNLLEIMLAINKAETKEEIFDEIKFSHKVTLIIWTIILIITTIMTIGTYAILKLIESIF